MHGGRCCIRFVVASALCLGIALDAVGQDGGDRTAPLPVPVAPDTAEDALPKLSVDRVSESCYVASHAAVKSNAGFVVGKTSVLVVDCFQSSALARSLLAEIRRVTPLPISHVVLTNWHYDHTVGNQVFGKEVPILAATESAKRLEKRLAADRLLLGKSGMHASLDITKVRVATDRIDKERTLDLGGLAVRLSVAGGCSSDGDLAVYVPAEKVLFAGDLVWNGLHPNVSEGSTFRWIAALASLQRLEVEHLVPGHGAPGDAELIVAQRQYLMTLRRLVKHLAKRQVEPEKIIRGLEVPHPYEEYECAAWWPTSVRYVFEELMQGR